MVSQTPKALEQMELMQGIDLSPAERRIFAEAAKELRWDADEVAVDNDALLLPRRTGDRAGDLFTTFNVLQEKVIRGGVNVMNKETRRSHRAREVKGVSENVKLNKALWTLAEEMRKLKAA